MKKLLLLILTLISLNSFAQKDTCTIKGDGKTIKSQYSDSLKNRSKPSKFINKNITLDSIIKTGYDLNRFSDTDYVVITGYLYDVKYSGPESCNCHTTDKTKLDLHIRIVNNVDKKAVIVEITRYSNLGLTIEDVRNLRGKKVEVGGWMFFDEEHKHNAYNTNPNGTYIWRTTAWEIHPVLYLKEVK